MSIDLISTDPIYSELLARPERSATLICRADKVEIEIVSSALAIDHLELLLDGVGLRCPRKQFQSAIAPFLDGLTVHGMDVTVLGLFRCRATLRLVYHQIRNNLAPLVETAGLVEDLDESCFFHRQIQQDLFVVIGRSHVTRDQPIDIRWSRRGRRTVLLKTTTVITGDTNEATRRRIAITRISAIPSG